MVKETDSKSVGLCLRRFESCCRRFLPLLYKFTLFSISFYHHIIYLFFLSAILYILSHTSILFLYLFHNRGKKKTYINVSSWNATLHNYTIRTFMVYSLTTSEFSVLISNSFSLIYSSFNSISSIRVCGYETVLGGSIELRF